MVILYILFLNIFFLKKKKKSDANQIIL